MIDKALRDGSFLFEWTHRRLGGEEFPATVLLTRMEIGGETVVKASVRDITEHRRLEDKLRDASEYAQSIVNTVREPLVVLDDKFRVISANRSFYSTFQVTPEMSEHTLLFDLGNGQWEIPRLRELLVEVLPKSTSIEDFEVEHDFPTIGQKTMLLNARRIQSETGAKQIILLAIEDITERKASEEALLRANKELEGYAQTVSHDLKGPLTSTTLAATTLERIMKEKGLVVEGSEVSELLAILEKNVWKSAALIDDLLALAEAGQTPETLEPVDISEVVRSVLEEEKALLEDRGVQVSTNDGFGVASMDPTHAYQVFSNLVSNAVKHNDSENPEIHISRLVEARPGRLRYLVRDNGPGIPEEDMGDIFLPFHKEAGSTGTGIGLSIVDKVVRRYGGEMRVYNDGGAGFEFTLPIHSSQEP
jgi:signal transduction histidine kinase